MRRTNLFLASLTLFLFLAMGCQQKPESIVSSNEAEKSLSKENAERWFLKFKGRIRYSDGTVFESSVEKTVTLPRHLWGKEWLEQTESLDQNYYVEFVPQNSVVTLFPGASVAYQRYDLPVHFCTAFWSTRSGVTLRYNDTNNGGYHYSLIFDPKFGTIQGPFGTIPSGQIGTFWSAFSNEKSATLDNDGDIDVVQSVVANSSFLSGQMQFTSIKAHVRSRDNACQ